MRIRRSAGTLGVNASTFANVRVGCLGGVLLVLLTAGAMLLLVGMVWWMVSRNAQ
jgi:hypothetical protein